MGFLTMLRYFAEIAYPLPDAGALLTVAGFITATAIVVALSLSLSLSAPLLILQMGDGIRPRWTDIAWAQIIPSLVFFLYAFLAPSWDSLGTPWNWGVVVYASFVLIVLALGLKLFERTKNTPPSQRFKYLWLFCMCALSTAALAGGVNQLIQAMGGASILTPNQRGFTFLALYYVAVVLISSLSKVKPRTAFAATLSTVIALLFVGSIGTAELPKMLATIAGIRIKGPVDLLISKETCARVQMLAKAEVQERNKKEKKDQDEWKGRECAEGGALLRADVQVHSGGRWLLMPHTLDEVELPSTIGRFTAPDAAVELVLPTQETP